MPQQTAEYGDKEKSTPQQEPFTKKEAQEEVWMMLLLLCCTLAAAVHAKSPLHASIQLRLENQQVPSVKQDHDQAQPCCEGCRKRFLCLLIPPPHQYGKAKCCKQACECCRPARSIGVYRQSLRQQNNSRINGWLIGLSRRVSSPVELALAIAGQTGVRASGKDAG